MTHGLVMKVPAPTDFYDALHAEVGRRSTGRADGLLLHVGRVTDDGFEMVEIWESKDTCNRFFAEVVRPAVASVSGAHALRGEPVTTSRLRRRSRTGRRAVRPHANNPVRCEPPVGIEPTTFSLRVRCSTD